MPEARTWMVMAVLAVVYCAVGGALHAQVDAPDEQRFSPTRLQRIGQMIDRYIAAEEIAGAVTVVASKGRVVHFEARGLADIASTRPMTKDTVFELWSMTKPVTAVAILMLAEEGRLRLDDPVGRFVPEYDDLRVTSPPGPVATAAAVPLSHTPADRPMTIRDVLTHTSGLVTGSIGIARSEVAGNVPVASRPAPAHRHPG